MTDDATKMKQERDLALAECERLRAALAKANANHEEFERKWYLSKDECDKITELNHGQWLALENIRTLAARNRTEEWAGHVIRWCAEAGSVHQALRDVAAIDAARGKP